MPRPVGTTLLLHTTWFGSFLLENGEVREARLAPKDTDALARRLLAMEGGELLSEERALAKGQEDLQVADLRLRRLGARTTREPPPFLDPQEFGFQAALLREALIALGALQLKRGVQPSDYILPAVRALDDLTQTFNLLLERLRDWYALHFPELPQLVDGPRFLDLVATYGTREAMPLETVDSVGGDLASEDQEVVQALARHLLDLQRQRAEVEAYLEAKMKAHAPNIAHLVGPILGARLLSHAGGVEEMARMPASTIQLLGAERALFRHLRKGSKPPKHGVLLQHPWVHGAPPWQRGALARGFAGKLAIAARADAFTHRFLGDTLRAEMETLREKIARVREAPPARPRRPTATRRTPSGRRPRRGKSSRGPPRR